VPLTPTTNSIRFRARLATASSGLEGVPVPGDRPILIGRTPKERDTRQARIGDLERRRLPSGKVRRGGGSGQKKSRIGP